MILENESSLQRWLSNQLKPISDADPLALAMYVVALLKHHDKKGDVLKNHCYEQLLDFLKDHTRDFLDSLFNVLKDGSYKVLGVDDEFDVSSCWVIVENTVLINFSFTITIILDTYYFLKDDQARGDDDFEDEEDNSRRRDRRRDSDSFDQDDYDDRRKRSKHESESPTSSQSAPQVHPTVPAHGVNIQQQNNYNSSARENFHKENRVFQESQQRSYVEQERLKQPSHHQIPHQQPLHKQTTHKLPSHQQTLHQQPSHKQTSHQQTSHQQTLKQPTSHQQPSHQLASLLPTSHLPISNQLPSQQQHLVARGLSDTRLMGAFDGMGPETQRAIFGAMGGNIPILLAPQLQQQLPTVSSAARPRENVQTLDYSRVAGGHKDDTYTAGAIGFPPTYGAMGLPSSIFPAGFVPLQRVQPSGIQEADVPLPYSNQRPLPPPTDFPGPAKKPAPPSAPPPLPQMQLQQLYQPGIVIEQPQQQQLQQQQWRQERGFKNGGQNSRQGQGQGQGQGQNQVSQHQNFLPENERCTLKCTGLPQTAKEADLRTHFKSFGRVVELQLIEAEGDKKQYNDCLVQFGTAFEAKKCCNSPTAVLNNRFVRVMFSNFNIVPLADVLPLTAEEIEQAAKESAAAVHNARKTKKWTNEESTAAPFRADEDTPDSTWGTGAGTGVERRAKGVGLQGRGFGVSNKFIANHTMKSPSVSLPVPTSASTSAESSTSASGTLSASASSNEDPEVTDDPLYSSIEFTSDGLVPSATAEPVAAVSVPLTKEDIALQYQYEGLKALRQQADNIWKQKESLLQVLYHLSFPLYSTARH
jgi:hypothetical protein